MAKARRALAKEIPKQDVVIEILDARMPLASSNPMVETLRGEKPCLKILCRADLADPAVTEEWIRYLQLDNGFVDPSKTSDRVRVIASGSDTWNAMKTKVPAFCAGLAGRQISTSRPCRAIVVGIPNVGKSTLINVLLGRKVAKVGDEPAVTKQQQLVTLQSGMVLWDNPGLLWPKITDPGVGYRLAFSGAISEAALDYEPVARYGAELLLARYPGLLRARYKLKELPSTGEALLDEIGRRRGCLRGGGTVDIHKAADVLIHDFRSGALGRVSLERPDDPQIAREMDA